MVAKILQVCPKYYPEIGGIEEHVRNISERLSKKWDVTVATTDPSGKLSKREVVNSVEILRFKSCAPKEAYNFSIALHKFLLNYSHNFNIVHAHNYAALPALYAAQAKRNNKLVFTPHYHGAGHTFFTSLLHIPYKYFGMRIFKKSDRIVCVSHYEKSLIAKNFNVNKEKLTMIPNGVNLEEFKDLKREKKDNKTLLYVGRLERYKGVQYLIKILPNLDSDIVLKIVGKGPYKESLVKLTKKLDVEERVKFFQDLPRLELLKKFANANIFILLSKYEAYGISVAESLSVGTPCIVTRTSALTEWIDNENCFGINYPINSGKLRDLINGVIGRVANVSGILSWDQVAERLSNLYEEIVLGEMLI